MTAVTAIGIDVGAPRKGCHAVALYGDGRLATHRTADPAEMAAWCRAFRPAAIAIDAPCRWRPEGGRARTAERALAADRIACFSTPTLAKARGHAFYTWMFAGQELYAALAPDFPLYAGGRRPALPMCFETYPQAIACTFAGECVSAKSGSKRTVRGALLKKAGLDPKVLHNIDEIDAALCALTARRFAEGRFKAYGDAATGYIIVPGEALP